MRGVQADVEFPGELIGQAGADVEMTVILIHGKLQGLIPEGVGKTQVQSQKMRGCPVD